MQRDDFFSRYNNKTTTETKSEAEKPAQKTDNMDFIRDIASKYDGQNQDKLISDIIKNVVQQKSNGTLNNQQILDFQKKLSPMLSSDQRQRLSEIVEQILLI